jgi:hypothetical protein
MFMGACVAPNVLPARHLSNQILKARATFSLSRAKSDIGAPLKCDKAVKAAILVSTIHPVFTLNRAVIERVVLGEILSKSVRPFP